MVVCAVVRDRVNMVSFDNNFTCHNLSMDVLLVLQCNDSLKLVYKIL